jgi:RNA 3'-terminal phosphate cyclase (ATP)
MLTIDGSHGEGGGQVLRSSLTLSMITGRPFKITNIRALRPKPGLRPQHLACVMAAAQICDADVEGAGIGSRQIVFKPGRIRPGRYRFSIGTAGSTSLLFQTLALPLALCTTSSTIRLEGGTHVPFSPCFHYLEKVYIPALRIMGLAMEIRLTRWGFYPKGGGIMETTVAAGGLKAPFVPKPSGEPKIFGISASARLPEHVRTRQARSARDFLARHGIPASISLEEAEADSPGSLMFLWTEGKGRFIGASALGRLGLPAEEVGKRAAREFIRQFVKRASCDRHLSDQLLIPAALAPGRSTWTTSKITTHFTTNAWVVQRFIECQIEYAKEANGLFTIRAGRG